MKPEVLTALKGSIEHWRRIVNRQTRDKEYLGPDSCDLCALFLKWGGEGCANCPVGLSTASISCENTPYNAVYKAWNPKVPLDQQSALFYERAQKELEFLESLLPEGERSHHVEQNQITR